MKKFGILYLLFLVASCSSTGDMSCGTGVLLMGVGGAGATCNKADGDVFTHSKALSNESPLYIYRPYSPVRGSSEINVYVNNEKYGSLKNNGYLRLDLPEEGAEIRTELGSYVEKIHVTFEGGKNNYLRATLVTKSMTIIGDIPTSENDLVQELVQESDALDEIRNTRLSN